MFSEETEPYLNKKQDILDKYYIKQRIKNDNIIDGYATQEGTKQYFNNSRQYNNTILKQHFRKSYVDNLTLGSTGIGTYIGAPDNEDDLKMFNSIVECVQTGGVNVIDTAINYRYMKSERVVGAALKHLIYDLNYKREQLFICSKNGFLPTDIDNNIQAEDITKQLITSNQIQDSDVVGTVHCMHPAFLKDQLQRSLNNLGLECIDLMYLHNSTEVQMPIIGEDLYFDRLAKAFEFYEEQVQLGKIKKYGLATWTAFRAKPSEKNIYLELQKVVNLAQKIGGENHNMRYIQLPLNMIMHEAFSSKWQNFKQEDGQKVKEKLLTVARLCNINVMTSSPLWQGAMLQVPMSSEVFHCQNIGAKHINFIRSIPSEAIKTILIGMKRQKHVQSNLELLSKPILQPEEFWEFLRPPQEDDNQVNSNLANNKQ